MLKLNFIQDLASPHNNVLLREINADKNIDLELWYCNEKPTQYEWKEDLTNAIKPAKIYKPKSIDFKFLWHCIKADFNGEKFLIVGWANINTRILLILFWLLHRKFNVWFDFPQDNAPRSLASKMLRELFYFILKTSKAKVFCVGKMTINYFKNRGFNEKRLVNLPIFIDITKTKADFSAKKKDILAKFKVNEGDFLLSAGSRLVYDKGFDILIEAINKLPQKTRKHIKCVIIGKGEEEKKLRKQISDANLEGNIFMEPWMDINDFKKLLAVSDVFSHPARFDAFGGGTLNAMAVGTPVIGTYQAGSSPDRIENEINGKLYDCDDVDTLCTTINDVFENRKKWQEFGLKARKTAKKWCPKIGLKIVLDNIS